MGAGDIQGSGTAQVIIQSTSAGNAYLGLLLALQRRPVQRQQVAETLWSNGTID
jgi:hypothetical protein